MGVQSVKIPVELQIHGLQNEVARMKKLLGEVKPNTKAFESLRLAIDKIDKNLISLENRSKQTFSSQGEITGFAKSFDKIGFAMQDVYSAFQRLDFSDLNLSEADPGVQRIRQLGNEIEGINKKTKAIDKDIFRDFVKIGTLQDIFNLDDTFDTSINTLEQGAKIIKNELQRITQEIKKAEADISRLEERRDKANESYKQAEQRKNKADQADRKVRNDAIKVKNAQKTKDVQGIKDLALEYLGSEKVASVFEENLKTLKPEQATKRIESFFASLTAAIQKKGLETKKALGEAAAGLDAELDKYQAIDDELTAATDSRDTLKLAEGDYKLSLQDLANAQRVAETQIESYRQEIDELKQKILLLSQELKKNNSVTRESAKGSEQINSTLKKGAQGISQAREEYQKLSKTQESLNNVKGAIKQWFGFNEVINLTKRAVRDAISQIKELDSVMTEIAVVTDMTQAELWDQIDLYSEMAKQYGVATSGVYEVSMLYYQQGLQTAEVMEMTEETLKMAKIAGLDYAEATDYMTVAIRGFKMEMSDAQRVVDVYSNLAAVSASDTEELAVAMSKTASSAEAVGSSFENTSAMIALMVETTREAPENIGSALKSIISRFGEMTTDPTKLVDSEGEVMSLNKVDKALRSVGISLQDAQGNFRDFDDVILELSNSWDTIDRNTQRYIATIMAGNRQQSRFLALVGNNERLVQLTEEAANSEDAATIQAAKTMDSIASKIEQVKTSFQQFYSSMGFEEMFKGTLDWITKILSNINKMSKAQAFTSIFNIIKSLKNIIMGIFNLFEGRIQKISKSFQLNPDDKKARTIVELLGTFIDKTLTKVHIIKVDTKQAEAQIANLGNKANKPIVLTAQQLNDFNLLYDEHKGGKRKFGKTLSAQGIQGDVYAGYMYLFDQMRKDKTAFGKLNDIIFADDFEGSEFQITAESIRKLGVAADKASNELNGIGEEEERRVPGNKKDPSTATKKTQIAATLLTSAATVLSTAGAALTAAALAIKDSSKAAVEKSKTQSGWGNILSGLGAGIGTGVTVGMAIGGPYGAIAGIILGAITSLLGGAGTGISQLIDGYSYTIKEKIDNAEDELQELQGIETQKKAEEASLKTSLSELKSLEKAQYDSAQAAQAYKGKMNEIAEKYPDLINGYDSAGNAIISAVQMEEKLAQARLATAQASNSASEKEWWIAELRRRGAETFLNTTFSADSNLWEMISEEHFIQSSILRDYLGIDTERDMLTGSGLTGEYTYAIDLGDAATQERLLNLYDLYGDSFLGYNTNLVFDPLTNQFKIREGGGDQAYFKSRAATPGSPASKNSPELSLRGMRSLIQRGISGEQLPYNIFALSFFEDFFEGLKQIAEDNGLNLEEYGIPINEIETALKNGTWTEEDSRKIYRQLFQNIDDVLFNYTEDLVNQTLRNGQTSAKEALTSAALTDSQMKQILDEYSGIFTSIGGVYLQQAYENYKADGHEDATWEDWKATSDYTNVQQQMLKDLSFINEDLAKIWDNMSFYNPVTLEQALRELNLDEEIIQLILGIFNDSYEEIAGIAGNRAAGLKSDTARTLFHQTNSKEYETVQELVDAAYDRGFSLEDIGLYVDDAGLYQFMADRTQEQIDNFNSLLSENVVSLFQTDGIFPEDALSATFYDDVLRIFDLLDGYYAQGFTQYSDQLAIGIYSVFKTFQFLPDEYIQEATSILDNLDYSNLEEVINVKEKFESLNTSGQYDDIISNLQFVIQTNSSQVKVLGQIIIDKAISINNKIKDFYTNVTDGFDSLEDVYSTFDSLEGYESLLEGRDFNTFFKYDEQLNKWVLTAQGLGLLMGQETKSLIEENNRLQAIKRDIENGNFGIEFDPTGYVDEETGAIKWDELYNAQTGEWTQDWEGLNPRTQEYLIWAKDNGITELGYSVDAYFAYIGEELDSANLAFRNALIDIRSNIENSIDFSSIVSGEATAAEMKRIQGMFEAYFSVLAETKSLKDFGIDPSSIEEEARETTLAAKRTEWVAQRYPLAMQYLLQQNYEAFQTITGITLTAAEQVELATSQAEAELKTIQDLTSTKVGDWINVSHLVDILGEEAVSSRLGEINEGFVQISEGMNLLGLIEDIYASKDAFALEFYQLRDTIIDVFGRWADLLSDGLAGGLTYEGLEELKAQFPGLEISVRETTEGLKVAEGSVLQIYGHLKQVDTLASQIVLDVLIESTMDAEDGMNNIYNVLGRIKDLNEDIALAGAGSERQKALMLELELAEGIRDTLLEAGNAFNFMDQDLPTSLSNPLSLWEGVGDALSILDGEEYKDGLGAIDFTDFYNIINMMEQTGVDLGFAATEFSGDAVTAADLIKAAGQALTIVDGQPIVDLSKLGTQFNLGTEEMRKGLAEGIQTLAQNEIEMIDAAISLLETIVAMEKIGDIDTDKNGLELDELFVLDEDNNATEFKEGVTETFGEVEQALRGAGIEVSEVKIGSFTLDQLLVDSFEEFEQLGIDQDTYFALIKGIVDTVNSQDFDPNDIPGMFKLLGQNLNQEFTINTDKFSLKVTPSGDFFYIDWEAADIESQVKEAGFSSISEAQDAVTKFLNGENLDPVEYTQTLQLLGKLQVTDGKYIYIGSDGSEHSFDEPPSADDVAAVENQLFADSMSGGEHTYSSETDQRVVLALESGTSVEYLLTTEEGTYTGFYNGQTFTGSTQEAVEQGIADYIAETARIDAIVVERGTTPIEVQGKAYTKITLATGETVWQAEDGTTITNAGMTQLMTEEVASASDGEVHQIPVNAGLEISTVDSVSLGEGARSEEGLTLTDPIAEVKASVTKLTLGVSEEGSISLDETTLALIQDYNDALSTAADLSVVNSSITVTLTGLTAEDVTLIQDYNDAASAVDSEVTSTINGSITIPQEVLINILSLKEAVLALKDNPNISTTFATIAEENAIALIRDILAVYGYSGQTAELLFNAFDNGTVSAIVTELEGIVDKEISILANLDDDEAQKGIDDLTKPETKTITITYDEPTVVGPGPNTSSSGYYVSGIDNNSGNRTRVGQYSSLNAAADDITAKVDNGTFQNGTFEITQINADGTTMTTSATLAEISAGTVNFSGSISTGGVSAPAAPTVTTPSVSMGTITLPTIDTSQMMGSIQSAANDISSKLASAGSEGATSAAAAIKNTLASIKSKTVTIRVNAPSSVSISASLTATIRVKTTGGTLSSLTSNKGSVSGNTNTITGTSPAKGNVALAKGSNSKVVEGRTLMGELGPELVVAGGRYYTVGNNGAEFVDLPEDAIVFNHLQTKKLLGSNKGIVGTGEPVTNERKAVAFASGNVSGPAMASASDALAELYKLRAMWQGLLDASVSELGGKAGGQGLGSGKGPGSGGGSPGGGSGGSGSGEEIASVVGDLDRWYNLLRQIAKLEQQITMEQAKRENMRSGYDRNDSLEKELKLLKKQYEAQKKLSKIQKSYYDARRKDLEATDYSKIFTYDEDGLMQYVDGQGRGLDILATLNKTDANGKAVYNAKEQLKYLKETIGFNTDVLKTNADGTKAEDEEQMMQNFWDGIDGWMEEMDSLYDSYNDAAIAMEEATTAMNEILNEQIENQLTVEEKLMKALEAREQAEIDRIQDEKDALEEAAQEYIDGLNNALEKERSMYEKNESDAETSRLQRQLAILQRSGGSASEIKSLQDQIDSRLKEAYFEEQQNQIDAIQEASDNQLEKLQTQIDIMTEALEYQKENGLLWAEISEMMQNWTPEAMMEFIETFDPDYKTNSATQNQQNTEETLAQIQQWVGYNEDNKRQERKEKAWNDYYNNLTDYSEEVKKQHQEGAKKAFEEAYGETEDISAAEKAANEYYAKATAPAPQPPQDNSGDEKPNESENKLQFIGGGYQFYTYDKASGGKKGAVFHGKNKSPVVNLVGESSGRYQIEGKDGDGHYFKNRWISKKYNGKNLWKKYETGGLVDYTGPAWVDGSKSKPEAFLSAEDTAMLKSKIFSNSDGSLKALVAALEAITSDTSKYSATTTTESIIIQNAQVNIQPGTISNDYDARRAGEMALEEMVKIARKTTNRVVSR